MLRPYQHAAVQAVYRYLREHDGNPCVVLPTAAGKTWVISTICRDAVQTWNGRVVVLAHVKELLEQAVEKLRIVDPQLPVGVYSAGLKQRRLDSPVTVAGIQSIYTRANELGPIDLAIVDEAHLIQPGETGMYRQFLADAIVVNPELRVIGLTATPFRLKSGPICELPPDGLLNDICYEISVKELIVQGYLCPLRTRAGRREPDTGALHVRGGEFVAGELEALMDADELVESACAEIVDETANRGSVLIFAAGISHALHVCRVLEQRHDIRCGFVCGETLPFERAELLDRFRNGDLKYLCNVNVLTTGFDAPNIDCIAMLRPTLSPGLYSQMIGRGFRLHPGKADCLVLDFAGNVLRHGPVDQLGMPRPSDGTGEAPAKMCPECRELIHAAYARCPECGHAFPPPQRTRHEATASTAGIISGQVTTVEETVNEVSYHVHLKANDPRGTAPPTMRVEYRCGLNRWYREWICFEHGGYAREKAEKWWRTRSKEPVPDTVEEAVDLARAGALASTQSITIRRKDGDTFDRIIRYELGARPPRLESEEDLPECVGAAYGLDKDEIPF